MKIWLVLISWLRSNRTMEKNGVPRSMPGLPKIFTNENEASLGQSFSLIEATLFVDMSEFIC